MATPWCQEQSHAMPNKSAANLVVPHFETCVVELSDWENRDPLPPVAPPSSPDIVPLPPADAYSTAALPGTP